MNAIDNILDQLNLIYEALFPEGEAPRRDDPPPPAVAAWPVRAQGMEFDLA